MTQVGPRVFATGFEFPEGPSFDRAGNLYVTDGGLHAVVKVAPDGSSSIFVRPPGGSPNGSAFDRNGDLYIADPGSKRVLRADSSGKVRAVASNYKGAPLLGPNDVTFDFQGRLYFTDPHGSSLENPIGCVYRADTDGSISCIAEGMAYPNGLAVTADGQHLIVAETFSEKLFKFSLDAKGNVKTREEYAFVGTGLEGDVGPDGMAFDAAGFLYVAIFGAGVVTVVSPEGKVVETLPAGGLRPTNCAFGGPQRKTLYVTETEKKVVVTIECPRPGLPLYGDLD